MTTVYKTLNEPQYLADKHSIKTVDKTTMIQHIKHQTTTSTIQQEKDTRRQRNQLHRTQLLE